jgi:hypothetical protein
MLGVSNLPPPATPTPTPMLFPTYLYTCVCIQPQGKRHNLTYSISTFFQGSPLEQNFTVSCSTCHTLCSFVLLNRRTCGTSFSLFICLKYWATHFLNKFLNGQFHEILYIHPFPFLSFSLLGLIIKIFQRLSEIFETFRIWILIRIVLTFQIRIR